MTPETLHAKLETLLQLKTPPVAMAFLAEAPVGVTKLPKSGPSSCSYWSRASQGEIFYTTAEDHLSCPIGAYTHGVPMPEATAKELEGMMGMMFQLEYLKQEEVGAIPTRKGDFGVVAYAPLSKAPFAPEVILVRGDTRQMMLFFEAAASAGLSGEAKLFARPTCQVIPDAMAQSKASMSLGCIGNRVYTGVADGESFCAIPGAALEALVTRLEVIVKANKELEAFHRGRMAARL